jgi:Domain of unknown function (DUF4388)
MLEQLDLSSVLRRVETYSKTGLMVIKQEGQWVELYFRDGRLMCLGPVRTNATLGERLLKDGVISPLALQETLLVVGNGQQSETRMALTLMDLGYVSHEELRAWATYNATEVLRALLSWTSGEVSFGEDATPPADRLLVALSVSALLSSIVPTTPAPQPISASVPAPVKARPTQDLSKPAPPVHKVPDVPTLVNASDLLLDDFDDTPLATAFSSTDAFSSVLSPNNANSFVQNAPDASIVQPVAVMNPKPPKRIDTSFMRPDMVLAPVDLSTAHARTPQVQLTPDQWRLLTKVDGRTSLQVACMDLAMTPELICQVAGELIVEGLIQLSLSSQAQMNELSPISKELVSSGINNGYVVPNYAASPGADASPQFASSFPCETQSQWGNGGNGATFVPGRGWIASPQPLQPLPTSGPLAATYSDIYAQVGGGR